jgi:hydroxypyruvate isomerase
MKTNDEHPGQLGRRSFLMAAGAAAGMMATGGKARAIESLAQGDKDFHITNGRIHQSIMGWTYGMMPVEELARHCKDIGLVAMEGIDAKHYPMIQSLGLKISLVGSHGFAKGPFAKTNHEMCEAKLHEGIDLAAKVGCKGVITFTGFREPGTSDEEGAKNCVDLWKRVMSHAEQKKINICLEHLNSRDSGYMKGHPGYFGDHVDFCVDLIKKVGSPNMKLLFDIYHVAIMDGDVIRRLHQLKDVIAHIHTAGVPGRAELDETQELNYPAIMKAILDIGFEGYVAQEFMPTWNDKVLALRHAARVCDV